MSKAKLQSIIILLFFIIFSYFYMGEYLDYHKNNNNLNKKEIVIWKKISDFSLKNINKIQEISIFVTPDEKVIEKLIWKIDNAKKRIYIEIYMFTNKKIISSIIKAKERQVDIKIIMEKNPYKIPKINDKTYKKLIKKSIDVVWSKPSNYSLNHTKMILIDDEIILSTWNLTYSTFKYNKDLFLFMKDKLLLEKLEKIFSYDYNWIKSSQYLNNLVLSPDYSRKKLEKLINSSKNEIKMYFPYIKDVELEKLIIKKAKEKVNIEIIVWKDFFYKENNEINELEKSWIKISYLKKYKLHAKSILVDNKYLFVWSINFSLYSLDKNREIWVIVKDNKIINKFLQIFKDN